MRREKRSDIPDILIPPNELDPRFHPISDPFTQMDYQRQGILHNALHHVLSSGIPGDVVEVGVSRGASALLLARGLSDDTRTLHLFDTFSGYPPDSPEDNISRSGEMDDISLEEVRKTLGEFNNIWIYPGTFPDSFLLNEVTFCFAHIDVSQYRSARDSCEQIYPLLEKGGIFLVSDYGDRSCPGVRRAVDEFFHPVHPLYLGNLQCLVIKP